MPCSCHSSASLLSVVAGRTDLPQVIGENGMFKWLFFQNVLAGGPTTRRWHSMNAFSNFLTFVAEKRHRVGFNPHACCRWFEGGHLLILVVAEHVSSFARPLLSCILEWDVELILWGFYPLRFELNSRVYSLPFSCSADVRVRDFALHCIDSETCLVSCRHLCGNNLQNFSTSNASTVKTRVYNVKAHLAFPPILLLCRPHTLRCEWMGLYQGRDFKSCAWTNHHERV